MTFVRYHGAWHGDSRHYFQTRSELPSAAHDRHNVRTLAVSHHADYFGTGAVVNQNLMTSNAAIMPTLGIMKGV